MVLIVIKLLYKFFHLDHTSVRTMLLEPISATLNLDLLKNADFRSEKENDYCEVTVQAPATSVLLTRKSGLKPLTNYVFEVRAWNYRHKGEWSTMSKYIGMFILCAYTLYRYYSIVNTRKLPYLC